MSVLFECRGVGKSFGALKAVNDVSFSVNMGECLGIMGPNGAGKSTLMNLIMGVMPVTSGTIHFNGENITELSTSQISQRGIGRTYQIPQPFTSMTVLENLLVGQFYGRGIRTQREAKNSAMAILERVKLAKQAKTVASDLGLLDLKRLELARALSLQPNLLLLDEIFGGLVDSEVKQLEVLIKELKAQGQTMLIIEHVLGVLFNHADRIMVLNFGQKIAEDTPTLVAEDPKVVEVYLGEDRGALSIDDVVGDPESNAMLSVKKLSAGYGNFQALFDISLDIYPGEVTALIGLNGAGKTTLIRAITKQLPLMGGEVIFNGDNLAKYKIHQISEAGIAQAIEGRKILPLMTVKENLEMGAYPPRARSKKDTSLERVYRLFPRLKEREQQLGQTLSGGEQQMLAIGRALMASPDLLILDEVSLGLAPLIIDDLYRAIQEIKAEGVTILLVEQSIQRSLEVADRAYIMEHGRIVLYGTAYELAQNESVRQVYFGLDHADVSIQEEIP